MTSWVSEAAEVKVVVCCWTMEDGGPGGGFFNLEATGGA